MKTQNQYYFFYYVVFLLLPLVGHTQHSDTRKFQLSMVPPVSSNGSQSGQITNKFSLNLIAGYANGVEALEIGGIYNIVKGNVRGAQISGFGNQVGGSVNGLQIGGFINTNKGHVAGTQIAGFLNHVSDSVNGWQVGGFTNLSKEAKGVQVAGFSNHSQGTQGTQVAGFINTTGDLQGFQMAGFINVAKEVRGVQFGIINLADSVASGVQFGLLNLSKKNGFISPAIESDDVTPYRLAFRSGREQFYSILTAGMHGDDYWSYGIGFGSRFFPLNKKTIFLNPELGWHHINKGKIKSDQNNHLLKLNFNLGYKIFKRQYITAGPTLNLYISNRLDESDRPVIPIANNPFLDSKSGNNRYQMWIGYNIGIGF